MKPLLGIIGGTLKTLFGIVGAPFKKLPFCSLPGAVVGSFAGFVFGLIENEHPGQVFSAQQLVVIAVAIALVGLLLVLLLFGLILRYGINQIFWPASLNALVTSLAAVFVNWWLKMPAIAGLVGLVVGILVGALLCWFCWGAERRTYAKA
jgi:hypothetical protein